MFVIIVIFPLIESYDKAYLHFTNVINKNNNVRIKLNDVIITCPKQAFIRFALCISSFDNLFTSHKFVYSIFFQEFC